MRPAARLGPDATMPMAVMGPQVFGVVLLDTLQQGSRPLGVARLPAIEQGNRQVHLHVPPLGIGLGQIRQRLQQAPS